MNKNDGKLFYNNFANILVKILAKIHNYLYFFLKRMLHAIYKRPNNTQLIHNKKIASRNSHSVVNNRWDFSRIFLVNELAWHLYRVASR